MMGIVYIRKILRGVGTILQSGRNSMPELSRKELVLAALSPANKEPFEPVHVQKLFFLIDKKAGLGREYYNFEPYDYGPFDKQVYCDLEDLADEGKITIAFNDWGQRQFMLTDEGLEEGESALNKIEEETRDYITTLSDFVRNLSFAELVSTIYRAFPEMKENSVFAE